jgi:hypothetical protein
MPVSRALRNLLKVRNLEVEQHKAALESALNELHVLENALDTAQESRRLAGKCAFEAAPNEGVDRLAFQLQRNVEERRESWIRTQHAAARERAQDVRAQFMSKHMEQRQAESLAQAAHDHAIIQEERRLQRAVDDLNMQRRISPSKKR